MSCFIQCLALHYHYIEKAFKMVGWRVRAGTVLVGLLALASCCSRKTHRARGDRVLGGAWLGRCSFRGRNIG